MNRLDELIAELCPDGVAMREVGYFAKNENARNKDLHCSIAYSITKGGLIPTNEYFKEAKVTSDDTSSYKLVKRNWFVYSPSRIDVGSINYLKGIDEVIVSPLNVVFSVNHQIIDIDYLMYFFASKSGTWQILQNRQGIEGTGRKLLPFEKFSKIRVPVPPLPVQREIVRILDTFTELTARQKQYKYYASMLFENAKAVRPTTLDEISENCDYMRKPVTSGKREAGDIPYYGASGIVDYVKDYIFDGDYLLISEDGANLIARSTPIAFSITGRTWVNNHAHILKFNSMATQKYVERYLNLLDLTPFITGAAQPKLNQKNLNLIQIPLPPMEEQIRIMSILDRFDTITNDINDGLPAEIAARQKQYEYYRDKLLTFKPLAS